MAAKDLGTKHTCFKCGTKFYDLRKPVPVCPKCGADQRESPVLKPVPEKRRAAAARPVQPVAEVEEGDEVKLDEDAEVDEDAELDEAATDDDDA
jgi:uncharacterized protein (TIGR02300 family)